MNFLERIQAAKEYANSRLLNETSLTTETDSAMTKAFWARADNRSKDYHMKYIIQAAQDYFMTKTTVTFVSGTERYDLPGNSIKIRYVEKTDIDPDEVIKPINIDQRLDYTDQEDDTDDDDALDHFAYLFDRTIGIVPNMDSGTGSVSLFYIRRLPDSLYGTCTVGAGEAAATTLILPVTPTFGVTSLEDDKYNNARVKIISATTGSGQIRTVTDYVGSTRTCTVATWTTALTGTIVAEVMCDIPEEYHDALVMYSALLGLAKEKRPAREVKELHNELLGQMIDGLHRWDNKGKIVNYQDL